jgi:hypothetical protein
LQNAATVFERDAGALEQLEANIDAYFSQRRTPTETFERSRVFTGGLENEDVRSHLSDFLFCLSHPG